MAYLKKRVREVGQWGHLAEGTFCRTPRPEQLELLDFELPLETR